MTVSVIIPCFNAEATLEAAIESALSQGECEVVVIDDGSRDGSLALARGYGDRVTLITGPNRGVSAARNLGIEAGRGDWLVFLDSDDLLAPETLARRLQAAPSMDAEVIVCDWWEFDVDARFDGEEGVRSLEMAALEKDAALAIAAGSWAPTAALMYRRDLVEAIGGFRDDLPVIQDARFMFDAAWRGARFGRSPHVGAAYRILPQSLSRRDPSRFWRDVLTNGVQIEALWRDRGLLAGEHRRTLSRIYDNAARGLFAAGDPTYFEAAKLQSRLGEPSTWRVGLVKRLAMTVGLPAARRLVGLVSS